MFKDKHIVITGGSSGLGLELARRLAAEGARLTLVARDKAKLDAAAKDIRAHARDARVAVESLDVRNEDAAQETMDRIAKKGGGIDVLINSAGILREGPFDTVPLKTLREIMEVNYFGLALVTHAALPHLKASKGRIVNIGSMSGLTGVFGYTAYSASKHALLGFSDSLYYELKPHGVRVQLVCPPEFDSPMVDEMDTCRTPENKAHTQTISKMPVEPVAQAVIDGMRGDRFLIVPGAQTRFFASMIRHFPGMARTLGNLAIARVRRAART